jgi:hypothetical protein
MKNMNDSMVIILIDLAVLVMTSLLLLLLQRRLYFSFIVFERKNI